MKTGTRGEGLKIVVDLPWDASACMGTGAYSEAMVRALAQAAPESRIALAVAVGHERRLELPNVHYVALPETDGLTEGTRQVALPSFLAASAADCLFAPASLVPSLKVCPTVATIHDLTFETHSEQYSPGLVDYLKQWFPVTLAAADRLVAISEPVRQDLLLRKKVDPSRVVVIEQPIREVFREALDREEVARELGTLGIRYPYLFHVSNLAAHKNMEFGVRVLAEFLRRNPDSRLHLLFAGGGVSPSRPPDLVEIAYHLGIGDRVRYVGKVSDRVLQVLYQGCEAFLFPSLVEGWGLPVVEARTMGAKVLSSPFVPSASQGEMLPLDISSWVQRLEASPVGPPCSKESPLGRDAGEHLLAAILEATRACADLRPSPSSKPRRALSRVVVRGDWYSPSGFGQAGRSVFRALESAGLCPVASLVPKDTLQDKRLWRKPVTLDQDAADLWIHHVPPEHMDLSLPGKHASFFFWETDRLPERSRAILSRLDEVWAPSSFVAEVLRGSGLAVPVVQIPPPVDTELYAPGPGRRPPVQLPTGFDRSWTVFLYVGTWDPRKRPDLLVRSFTRAFRKSDRALLLIKSYVTGDPSKDRDILSAWIESARASDAHIQSIAGVLSDAEMADLFRFATVFATASRGEGYCLPAVQAMSAGKPVIAAGWSAFSDYISIPVRYSVRPIPPEVKLPGYTPDQRWAEIEEDDLAQKLRWAHEHADQARTLGQKARSWVEKNATKSVVGRLLQNRIHELCRFPLSPKPEEVLS